MLNIVLPMAGRGSRFVNAGYSLPKPLVTIHGKPMIEVVVNNLRPVQSHRFIFICLAEHIEQYALTEKLFSIAPDCEIISVSETTEGAACTVLLAERYIDNTDALMVANSDQYVDIDINSYLNNCTDSGTIMTMLADDKKWSYIRIDADNNVCEVREKEVISNEATVGIYNYTHGADYVKYAKQMIAKDIRVNGEFYVAPVYNEMIADGGKVGYYNVGAEGNGMYGLGTPEDLKMFISADISKKAAGEKV